MRASERNLHRAALGTLPSAIFGFGARTTVDFGLRWFVRYCPKGDITVRGGTDIASERTSFSLTNVRLYCLGTPRRGIFLEWYQDGHLAQALKLATASDALADHLLLVERGEFVVPAHASIVTIGGKRTLFSTGADCIGSE